VRRQLLATRYPMPNKAWTDDELRKKWEDTNRLHLIYGDAGFPQLSRAVAELGEVLNDAIVESFYFLREVHLARHPGEAEHGEEFREVEFEWNCVEPLCLEASQILRLRF